MKLKVGACALVLALSGLACRTVTSNSEQKGSQSAAESGGKNALLKSFYANNQVIEVEITTQNWDKIRNQEPKGGRCNFSYAGPQYDWFEGQEIKINGKAFKKPGLKKKSWCGSESKTKPSLNINLSKFNEDNKDLATDAFGTDAIILNNSMQDEAYVRQCFSYKIFERAGVPAPLCNFAHLKVNGKDMGLFVNLQPLKKAFYKEHFGSDDGNVYEIAGEWLDENSDNRFRADMESNKKPEDTSLSDLKKLIRAVNPNGTMKQVEEIVDVAAFVKFWAAEVLLTHYDGFTLGNNNSYLFFPTAGKMRPIPWGTDFILARTTSRETQQIYKENFLAAKLSRDANTMADFNDVMQGLLENVWKEEALIAEVDAAANAVRKYVPNKDNQQGKFNDSLNLLKSNIRNRRGQLSSLSTGGGRNLRNARDTGFCLNTQNINGQGVTNVYGCGTHQDQKWELVSVGEGYSHLRNPANNVCINLRNSNNGGETDAFPCDSHADQSWKITNVESFRQFESRRAPGLCLSINNAQDGNVTIVKPCDRNDKAQLWLYK